MKKLSILSVSLLTVMTGAVLSPILPQMQQVFAQVDRIWIESLVTIPSLMVVLLLPLINRLRITLKVQTLVGLAIYGFGGLVPLIFTSFSALVISRILTGVALAFIAGPAISLITTNYEGKTAQQMIGFAGAVTNGGTIISVLYAGLIVALSWRAVFWIYVLGFVAFALVWFFVPQDRLMARERVKDQVRDRPVVYLLFFLAFSLMIIYFILPTNLPFFVTTILKSQNSLYISLLMASVSVVGFVTGIFYQKIPASRKQKGMIVFIGFAIGMGSLMLGQWLPTLIAMPLFGLSLGLGMPLLNEWVALTSTDDRRKNNLAISNAMIFAGQFASPFILGPLTRALKLSETATFGLAAILALLLLLVVNAISKQETA